MSKITLKEMPNTVVHCKTKEEYDRLMQIYEDGGWLWCNGNRPTHYDFDCGETASPEKPRNHIIVMDGFYWRESPSEFDTAINGVLSLSDFLREQGLDTLRPEQLKPGDWVELLEDHSEPGFLGKKGDHFEIDGTFCDSITIKGVYIYPHNLAKFRRIPSPSTKTEGQDYCSQAPKNEPFWKGTHTVACRSPFEFSVTFNDLIILSESLNPRLTSLPLPPMSCVDDAVTAYRNSKLNPVERRLRKAGFRDPCGNWTDKAVRTFIEMKLDEEGHKVLDPIAKSLLKKEKDEDTDD